MTSQQDTQDVDESASEPTRSWPAAIGAELREHAVPYAVLLAFVIAGPVVTHFLFPEAPRGAGLFGGMAFGAYAAISAMPGRFF